MSDDWDDLDWEFLDEELDEVLVCSLENPEHCDACQ